jgi:hypothetical protein
MKNATVVHKDKVLSYDDSFTNQYHVPVPVNNLIHTDSLTKTHRIWDTINNTTTQQDIDKARIDAKAESKYQKHHNSMKQTNKAKESVSTCKKCGGPGHFTFECMNNIDISGKKTERDDLHTQIPSDDENPKKKTKKEKKDRKPRKSHDDKRKHNDDPVRK